MRALDCGLLVSQWNLPVRGWTFGEIGAVLSGVGRSREIGVRFGECGGLVGAADELPKREGG